MAKLTMFSSAGDKVGLAFIAAAGLISALSTFSLLSNTSMVLQRAYIVEFISHSRKKNPSTAGDPLVCAFVARVLPLIVTTLRSFARSIGIAFAMNFRWSVLGEMSEGKLCTIQGAMSEVGDLGAAIWTIAIAFHTFWLLFLVRKPHHLIAPITLICGWSILVVLPILGPLVIQTPGRGYGVERLIYLYLSNPILIPTMPSDLDLYGTGVFNNNLHRDGKLKFQFQRTGGQTSSGTRPVSASMSAGRTSQRFSASLPGCFDWAKESRDAGPVSSGTGSGSDQATGPGGPVVPVSKHLKNVARRLMWYPVVYTVVVLPVSICRMGVLAEWTPPFGLFVFAGICFASSGVSNCVLFITTRHTFIKQIARTRGTRVHITTRITVHDDTATNAVEMYDLEEGFSPATQKSPYYTTCNIDSPGFYPNSEEKVEIIPEGHNENLTNGDKGRRESVHITVLG
ncbi:hypothetical protein K439DRAFT_1621845 [Ramaria rubella]|nr:hypothetical protein K439DRAFT_1621845 [Ramaria rubella]